ncbi:uncharacterized protein LOC143196663 isoform X6 [Rhynchophorus ferrugineus]
MILTLNARIFTIDAYLLRLKHLATISMVCRKLLKSFLLRIEQTLSAFSSFRRWEFGGRRGRCGEVWEKWRRLAATKFGKTAAFLVTSS